MAILTIDIPADAERQLREEAARRNATAEAYAASLLVRELKTQLPGEFEIDDDEIATIQEAIREVREQVKR